MSVVLSELPKTALFSFWARVADAQAEKPVLNDRYAVSIAEAMESEVGRIIVPDTIAAGSCMRAKVFDEFLQKSLLSASSVAVVEIGPGLDCRYERLNPVVSQWIDVDFPEIIELRKRFMSTGRGERSFVASETTDPSVWRKKIRNNEALIVIAQGVLQYWNPGEVSRLFRTAAYASEDSRMIFDSMAPPLVRMNNKKNEKERICPDYQWSVWNTENIGAGQDFNIRIIEEKNFMDMDSSARKHMPFMDRMIYGAPFIRNFYRMTLADLSQKPDYCGQDWGETGRSELTMATRSSFSPYSP